MIIKKIDLQKVDVLELEENLVFEKEKFANHVSLIDIKDVHVLCGAKDFGNLIRVSLDVTATLIIECAYTLEPFPKKIKVSDDLDFVNQVSDDDNCIFHQGKEIDLDPYILGMIVTEIPLKMVKPGAKRPESGAGYRVISDEDYFLEKENKVDPRFAALDDFEE